MQRLLCLAIGYVCGLLQTSYIYGRMHGIDIRNYGSGNAGTTNALRTLGKKAGLITLLGDALKCIVAVVIAWLIFRESHPEMVKLLELYAAAGTILGHNFPFYLKFRGGKGIAATAGLLASVDIRIGVVALIVFIIVFLTTHYVSLGSIMVYVTFVAGLVVLGENQGYSMDMRYVREMYIIAAALAVMAIYKHRANIQRLLSGTENKTYLSSKKKAGQR